MSVNAAWQIVTCSDCARRYRCTPSDDYYSATTLTDGVCEYCLVTGAGLDPARSRRLVRVADVGVVVEDPTSKGERA